MSPDHQKRKDAVRALVNIALLEALLLAAVVAVYLYTNKLAFLIGGIVGAAVIVAPAFIRWAKEHGPAFKGPTNDGPAK